MFKTFETTKDFITRIQKERLAIECKSTDRSQALKQLQSKSTQIDNKFRVFKTA